MLCIAMCYGDRPERRFVTGRRGRLTYVSASKENSTDCSGVGFPNDAVFEFDERLFESLRAAWAKGDRNEIAKLKGVLKPMAPRLNS